MSLQGSNTDGEGLTWDLDHITKNYPDARHCFHIVNGSDGTGDVYNWNNVQFLRQVILTSLAGSTAPESRGRNEESLCSSNGLVDLVVADGGFEAQRDSECQEDITSKLIVCQVAAGLSLLKPGGNFCVKMFGFQTATSQNVLAMLCHCFDRISILKPIASRPASAERYVVGIGRNPHVALSLEECEIFLQSGFQSSFSKPSIPHSTLTNFLLSFERDLLLLNTKACKHILTVFKAEDESLFLSGQHPSTNLKNQLKAYKMSWLL
jgi:cap1 methyltransferase